MTFDSLEPSVSETPAIVPIVPERKERRFDVDAVEAAVLHGREFLYSVQREDAHWCAELESNVTISAEYVLLAQILGRELGDKGPKLTRYLCSRQNRDGGWGIAQGVSSDVSTSTEVYLALRILGMSRENLALTRAEQYIRGAGGIEKVRVFTRIFFAMFGLMPWESIPAIPPEFILVPPQSPVNIYSLSSWARGTMVPLFVIFHHQPIYALPNGRQENNPWLDHLWLNPSQKKIPYSPPLPVLVRRHGISWTSLFGLGDSLVRAYERIGVPALRKRALERCTQWILDRQEKSGDWAGIFPPMLNSVIALLLQGYDPNSEPVKKGLEAIDNFAWEDFEGLRIQACVSPVWDTVLSAISLVDSGTEPGDKRLERAMAWVKERQLNVEYGDWKVYRPKLISGGWSFEYFNSWYPDVDDTAAVVIALLKQDPGSYGSETVRRALLWMLGMQNKDGGWAAFDVDNDKLFLNRIPFSDMDSLCDPSSPDVSGRVLEAMGLWLRMGEANCDVGLKTEVEEAIQSGIRYLRETQEEQGSWFGRWGVNYIYGTSNVLCGLAQVQVPSSDPMVRRALQWLKVVQNVDGGWGEDLASYADSSKMGEGPSSPSSTAWAVMGLLAYLSSYDVAVESGVRWLVGHQVPARPVAALEGGVPVPLARGGTWDEDAFTGTGFPNHFYLRYHYYRHYFPMMALGRYLRGLKN